MPADTLFGSPGPDDLQVGDGSGHDVIHADAGHDTLRGLGGDDTLWGEGGNDRILGGAGHDEIDGSDGNDRLWGEAGNDRIEAGWGDDIAYGGSGNDAISAGYGSDLLYGGGGNDGITMVGYIRQGNDSAYGGGGDDVGTFIHWGEGHFDGGTGQDTVALYWFAPGDDYWARVEVDLTAAIPFARSHSDSGAAEIIVTFSDVEVLQVLASFGSDTVKGGGGDDQIAVHLGDNIVNAGGGDDLVSYLTAGENLLDGGAGVDTLVVGTMSHLLLSFDASGGSASDGFGSVLTGFERYEVHGGAYGDRVTLGGGADLFNGDHGGDTARGGAGDDRLDGRRDNDVLQGEDGDDRLHGGRHNDSLFGGTGHDKLYGGAEDDVLSGGDGRDTLIGGTGTDVLQGDADADTFRFETLPGGPDAVDRIGDFATGIDRLVFLDAILAGLPATGRMTASDLAFGAVTGTNGQFLYEVAGSEGRLSWDSDGTGAGAATLMVLLTGAPALSGTDITIA